MPTLSEETVRQAFLAHRRAHGQDAAMRIIKSVTGRESLEDASDEEREELIKRFGTGGDDFGNEDGTLNVGAIYAKWNSMRRAPRAE